MILAYIGMGERHRSLVHFEPVSCFHRPIIAKELMAQGKASYLRLRGRDTSAAQPSAQWTNGLSRQTQQEAFRIFTGLTLASTAYRIDALPSVVNILCIFSTEHNLYSSPRALT